MSVAAHSPLMADAARAIARMVDGVPFADPAVPLLSNAQAALITTADGARRELVEHLTTGVDWVRAVESLAAASVDTFVELGPGKVLTNLIKRIAPEATAHAVDDPAAEAGLSMPSSISSLAGYAG